MPYTADRWISRRIIVKAAISLTAAILTAPTACDCRTIRYTVLKLPCSVAYMRFSETGVEADHATGPVRIGNKWRDVSVG